MTTGAPVGHSVCVRACICGSRPHKLHVAKGLAAKPGPSNCRKPSNLRKPQPGLREVRGAVGIDEWQDLPEWQGLAIWLWESAGGLEF